MKRSNQFSTTLVGLFTLGGLILFTMVFPFISPAGELQRAWQHANDVGVYAYKTEIIQTAHPLPILANVGLRSTENRISIQGQVNRPAKQMQIAMWDGSQVAVAASESPQPVANSSDALVAPYNSIQIKVDKDKSYGRTSAGEWQELKDQDVTGVFAPGKDVLGYLAAAKNVKPGATEIQGGLISTRYAFDVDGPTFAQYMNKQLQAELQRKGKLPPGLSLDMARQYAQWKGTGEMWVDAQGLPLRQTIKVAFPHPYNQETVEATIRTNFSNWRGNPNPGWAWLTLPQMSREDTQQASLTLAFLAFLLAGMGLMLRHWRSRRVYLVLALYVIIAMPLTPLFQGLQTHAFASEQQEKQQEQQQQQETNKALKQIEEEMLRSTIDPHTDPLLASRLQNEVGTYQSDPIYASDIAPNRNLTSSQKFALLQATQTPVPAPVDTDKDGLSDDDEKKYGTDSNKTDTDGDSLSDWQEVQIGTNPLDADTDGDGISDKTEVNGFISSGKRWFLNPLEPDTNKDGLSDGVECVELLDVAFDADLNRNVLDSSVNVSGKTCGDADGDGRPDAWTYDNDADGVPDSLDASPLRAMGGKRDGKTLTGFANQTLDFQLDKVSAGKPTFVDFQIRPTNSKHLAYANNVLDWPSNDRAGQIQRVKDTTFREFNGDSQPSDPKDSNGDVRLLPMLEIEIPYQQGTAGGLPTKCNVAAGSCPQGNDDSVKSWLENWLDKTALEDYGISVRAKDNTGSLLVYLPLNVISDPNGDNPVAFAGRMYYRPNTANFGLTQKVRLVWMLQALTDQCTAAPADFMKDAESATRYDEWCKDTTHWQSAISSIHTYSDDWYLTGLSVREDQGGKMGAIYQPPTGQTYDTHLWTVAQGLEKSFVPARADLTIDEIKNRFDAASNAKSTETQRWGIPQKALRVRVEAFKDESGVANFPTKYNQEILNSSFSSSSAATILYVREDTARTVSLDLDSDVIQASQAQLTPGFIAGSALTVKLDPNVVPSETMLSMSWASFRKNGASWEAYPIDDYNQKLAETFTPLLKGDDQDEDITAGKVVYLQSFYLALASGVQYTGNRLSVMTDADLKATLKPTDPARNLIKGYVSQDGIDQASAFKQLGAVRNGGTPKTGASKARSPERSSVAQAAGLVAGMQSALKTYMTIKSNPKWSVANNGKQTGWGVLAVKAGIQIKGIVSGIKELKAVASATKQVNNVATAGKLARRGGMLVTSYKGAVSAAKAIKTVKSITSGAKFLAGLGFVISIGISLGTFFYLWGSGAIKPGTPAFNQALALMIGEIIVAVIMLAIELIPGVGPIIVAVIALVDAVIGAICKAIGAKGDVADFVCSGLTGMLAQTLANIFYRYEPWVDLNKEERLDIGGLQQNLVNPNQGFVVGNTLQISAKVKSEIFERKATTAETTADVVLGVFTFGLSTLWTAIAKPDPDVRTTTLKYQLTRTKEESDKRIHKRLKLEPGQMKDEWKKSNNKLTQDVIMLLPLDKPGINVPDTGSAFYLAEGQAYNATETKASVSFEKKDVYDSLYISMGPGAVFDTLPATLDGFYQLAGRGAGYALAWDSKFPTLADADGDGLRSPAFGGNDPDDSQFDTDGDGLADFYEIQHAAQGFDPKKADTDGEGLSDYEELIYGTDPAKADSDYDGLTDYFEINGWDIVYGKDASGNKLIAHITSDPFNRDTDNDTISDYREMVFGTNPRVWSDPQVVKISSKIDDEDGYVAPSQVINYTAQIANKMLGRDVRGLLEVEFPPAVQDIRVQPKPFFLSPEQPTTMQGSVQVRPDAPTQKLDFTNRASSFIPNDQSQATRPLNNNKDDFIMRFDEPPKSTSFVIGTRDKDLSFTCEEVSCPDSGLPGVYNQAARFEAGDKLAKKDFSLSNMAAFGIWVNPSTQTTNEATVVDFIDYANNEKSIYRLGYDNSKQQVYFQFTSGDKSYHSTAVPVGQWTFVSITLGETIAFSVNGTQQTIATNSAYSGKYSPAIGGVNGTFTGLLDHFIIRCYVGTNSYGDVGMMRQAPVLTLHFDEPIDSTTFANANRISMADVTCSANECPKSGVKGQVRNAVQFDGVNDGFTLPKSDYFNQGFIGVAMWVKPTEKPGREQVLLENLQPATMWEGGGFKLSLDGELKPVFYAIVSYTSDSCWMARQRPTLTSSGPLILNEWNYVVATHDLYQGMKLYVNGYEVAGKKLTDPLEQIKGQQPVICPSNRQTTLGKSNDGSRPFAGAIDEVSIFSEQLLSGFGWYQSSEIADVIPTASQIAGTFNYQGAWYDASASHQVVVDADKPTVKLDVSATYLAKHDVVMPIVAQDATSGLATVEYQLDNGLWNQPTLDGGVWTFTYQPPSAGKHTIAVRATDRVGNTSSQNTNFIIDDTAPRVSLDGAGANEPQPIKADSAKDTWTVSLSGKVTESGANDSGVQALTVTFFDKDGGYIGKPRTTQTFAKDGTWKIDYSLGLKPDGFYPVQVEAVDKVGNLSSKEFTIALETTAPMADLATNSNFADDKGQPIANVFAGTGSKRPILQGTISDFSPPANALLTMHFEEATGATVFHNSSGLLHGTCNGASCPQAGTTGKYGNGLTFAGANLVNFSEGVNYRQTTELLKTDPNAYAKAANLPSKAMTVAAWVLVKQQNNLDGFVSAMQAVGGAEKGWMLGSRNGRFVFALSSTEADDGDGFMTYLEAPDQYTVGQWYYVVGTYDGALMKIYVDGDLKATSDVQSGDILYPASAWFGLGAYSDGDEEYRFNGQLDEVAIYERALRSNDIESQFVAASGIGTLELGLQHAKDKATNAPSQWLTVPLTLTQQRQNYATWSYKLPEGLEGPYTLWLRATDKAGNVRELPDLWQGILDTKVPQITLAPSDQNGKVEYTTKVEDFNLSAKDFNSPCGMEITKSKENNAETWYKETFATVDKDGKQIPAPNKLYRMTAQCAVTGTLSYQEVAVLQGKQVDIAANYAYVLQENGTDFSIFDLSNPTKPNLLYELKKGWFPIVSLTPSTDNTYLSYAFPYGFLVYNVVDLVAKKYTTSFVDLSYKNLTGVYTPKGSKYAYVMEDLYFPPWTSNITAEEFKKQTRQGKVSIFDYEQKQLRKGSYEEPLPRFVGVYGNYLLITGWHYGESKLKVLDISDPDSAFKEVAIYNNPLGNGFVVEGQYLYTVNNDGLQIFDLAQISGQPIPKQTCDKSYGWWPSCSFDRSYPNLSSVGSYKIGGYANDVAVVGNTAYLAGSNGVEVADITDKKNIRHITRYAPPAERKVDQVKVKGDTLFVKVTDPWDHNPSIRVAQLSKDNLPTATACDTFGNCTTQKFALTAALQAAALAADSAPPSLQADTPPSPITVEVGPGSKMLREANPISFTVKLQADAGLKDVTASIDGATLASQSWASSEVVTNVVGTLPMWVPKAEGEHTLVVQATDRNGATVRDESTKITLDTQAPILALKQTEVLNSQNYNAGTFMLQGAVTDTVSIGSVAATLVTAKGIEDLPVTFTDKSGSELTIPTTFANGTTTTGTVQWQAPLSFNGTSPNGLTATLTLTATDLVGHQTVVQKPLLIDAVAPTQGNITLGYKVKDQTTIITPGMTLAIVLDPEMVINWQPASDPSNIKRYLVGWSTSPTPTLSTLKSYAVGDSSHLQKVSDGQKWYAHVVAEDEAGNQAPSTLGPLYVDYATTPNYISMQENGVFPYRSWSESKCSLVGVDNRINERASSIASLKDSQKFYTTWNHNGLRLMWTGANWDVDGDLFIYLDTKDGGSSQLYNPYPATITNTAILLPPSNDVSSLAALQGSMPARTRLSATKGSMAADALLWVQGSMTATLLLWNGTAWQPSEGLTYFFDQNQAIPTTDLYVPFSALGIQDPAATTLSMLAVASEKNALRLWATMPSRNNLNSDRIIDSKGASKLQQFALTKNYTWKLTDGVCPGVMPETTQGTTLQADATQGRPAGADVKVSISSYPSGVAYSLLNDNLFFAMKDLPQFAGIDWGNTTTTFCAKNPDDAACRRDTVTKSTLQGTAGEVRLASLEPTDGGFAFNTQTKLAATMNVNTPPVGDKNLIVHTLELVNKGTETAKGIVADVSTWGAIRLPGGTKQTDSAGEYDAKTLQIGDLAPGKRIQVPIPAIVDATFDKQNQHGKARLDVTVYDSTGSHQQLPDGTDVYSNELDWLYVDHAVDTSPPDYIEILSPRGILGPGQNTINGFVYDRSAVPTVEMEIQRPDSTTRSIVCKDETPEDSAWACVMNTEGAKEGETFSLRVRATDKYGYVGAWSAWEKFSVDATPPKVSLDATSQAVLSSGLVGFNQARISGSIKDNRQVSGVDVCEVVDGAEACERANIVPNSATEVKTTYAYEDKPDAPLAIGKNTPCTTPLVRTFVVTDNFTISRASVGLNLTHTLRGDLNVTLQSPKGTKVTLLYDGTKARNYDVLIDDASATLDRDDTVDHDLASPPYKNQRGGYGLLSTFNGEAAAGTWKLTTCDAFSASDDGTYNQSKLIFESTVMPSNASATWDYTLPIPEPTATVQEVGQLASTANPTSTAQFAPNSRMPFAVFLPLVQKDPSIVNDLSAATPVPTASSPTATPSSAVDSSPKTLAIYGVDSMGNRTNQPLRSTYRVDNTPPAIQLTTATSLTLKVSDIFTGSTKLHLAGQVSDEAGIKDLRLVLLRPDSLAVTAPLTVTQTNWEYNSTRLLDMAGTYQWWVEANDNAANLRRVGPFTIAVQDEQNQ